MGIRPFPCSTIAGLLLVAGSVATAQAPPSSDPRLHDVIDAVSAGRLEADIRTLAGFGTRSTLSDTTSDTRGIGAATRWILAAFDRISADCGGCLDVSEQRFLQPAGERIPADTWIVNVVAVQRGTRHPNRYVIMSGDVDSRASDVVDGTSDAPGANDNASGMAGVLEAARVLTRYRFPTSIVYVGLSGEEQGLYGGQHLATTAREQGWEIVGVLNNDMIGNIRGQDGVVDNGTFRVFSEPTPATDTLEIHQRRRLVGGEVDGPSRQLARYVDRMVETYMPNLDAILIYRLDRVGRGGHHRPFNDLGFPAVRIMETHEDYRHQHQDVRVEDGVQYGDLIEFVDFDYAATITAANAITLAGLAWAPPAPGAVRIGGIVQPSTTLAWEAVADPDLAGYRLHWRDTTAPRWEHSRLVGPDVTTFTLDGLVIDNYLFGVSAVGADGHESVVVFPSGVIPARR
jgi:Zn-dependent M28 family amino/carboxypeptidase